MRFVSYNGLRIVMGNIETVNVEYKMDTSYFWKLDNETNRKLMMIGAWVKPYRQIMADSLIISENEAYSEQNSNTRYALFVALPF